MIWVWNNVYVNRKDVTSNVANILIDKLNRLTESQKSVLEIAACLGGSFSKSIIGTVIAGLCLLEREFETDWRETLASLDQSIEEFEQEGLWERDSNNENEWRFSHDTIQQVAFELIPIDQRDSFRGEIGSIMLEKLDSTELESNIFQVVSLRNCTVATLSNDDDRKELARLNLRAGMKVSMVFMVYFQFCVIVHLFLTHILYSILHLNRLQRMQLLTLLLNISRLVERYLGQVGGIQINRRCSSCVVKVQILASYVVIYLQCRG